ncbi:MAG: SDR family oxidoreductase [Acidobacteria bacterium]|nr:SDR family oxidoreductase [Acidobacteriota bacterium]
MNALVTGGTKGIGFAVAEAMLAAGGKVMITGRDEGRLKSALTALAKSCAPGAQVIGAVADMRDREAVEAAIDKAAATFGSIDTLINNAGVGSFVSVEDMTDDAWHQVIDTNLTGVFYATRASIPHLKRAGGGWIINIASLAGRNYFANAAAYCASKAGLVAFSEAVMLELRNDNIRVSVVMPGSVATEFSHPAKHEDESWKLTADDIAEVVMDLLRHPSRSLPSKIEIRPSKTK